MFKLTSSWPPARGVRVAADDTRLVGAGAAAAAGAVFQIVHVVVLQYLVTRVTLRCNAFLTFSWTSHLKHLLLRAFLEECLPEMLSKVGVLAERSMKKFKKHRAVAPAALGGCGSLGQLWEALAELWDPTLDPALEIGRAHV